jgi:hypothetical protein
LNFAIDILKEIKNVQITCDVFGPIEDEAYWSTCKENEKGLSKNVSFKYKGVLEASTNWRNNRTIPCFVFANSK